MKDIILLDGGLGCELEATGYDFKVFLKVFFVII